MISFDSQFLGIATNENGTFAFVFNVPHADSTKPHFVHTVEPYPVHLDIQAAFTVRAEPVSSNLGIVLETGLIYFPGDSVTIYVLTSQNGETFGPSGVQLQVSITRPDGTSSALNPLSIGTGLYTASFTIPKTKSTGTYAITATVSSTGGNAGIFPEHV